MSLEKLYLANNDTADKVIYGIVVPYFSSKNSFESKSLTDDSEFDLYDTLTPNLKRIFRDLVYDRHMVSYDLECTKDEFIELYKFLDFVLFNRRSFFLFRRYFIRIR